MVDTTHEKVFLARQPILDVNGKIVAYELLFRSSSSGPAGPIGDATQATARVLVNALNSMGINTLVGNHKAFINCDRRMLLESPFEPLDPAIFVVEILEDVVGDPEIIARIKELRALGYEIALDDFELTAAHLEKTKELLPLVQYIKFDLMLGNPELVRKAVPQLKALAPHLRFLAEKVETEKQHKECLGWGYSLFQGYYFAKPQIVEGRRLDPQTAGVMQLLQLLRKDPDIRELEDAFKRQPEVTLNMLKFINSASVGMRNKIESIRQALTMIGHRKLQQWLMLLLFAGSNGTTSTSNPLFENATQRGRMMENLARLIEPKTNLSDRAFLAGMLSRMDALCKVNIETILKEFDLGEELSNALCNQKGVLGDLLKIVASIELDEVDITIGLCELHHIDPVKFQNALTESWAWTQALNS